MRFELVVKELAVVTNRFLSHFVDKVLQRYKDPQNHFYKIATSNSAMIFHLWISIKHFSNLFLPRFSFAMVLNV